MIRLPVVGVLLLLLCLGGWTTPPPAHARDDAQDWLYISRPGETLQDIGERFLAPDHAWLDLMHYNGLADPFVLAPGTELSIPVAWLAQRSEPAILQTVSGKVWIRRAQRQDYQPATPGAVVQVGDEVKTGAGAATLRFADGSETDIAATTRLVINRMTRFGRSGMLDIRWRLLEGGAENRVSPVQQPAGRHEVTTPGAVAAVRGTVFRLHADGPRTRAEVIEGSVELRNGGALALLQAGEGTTNAEGGILVQTLPEPPPLQVASRVEAVPLVVRWEPVSAAAAYRVRLHDENSGRMLREEVTTETSLTLAELRNGLYRVSIRTIAADRLEGREARAPIDVRQEALPVTLSWPEDSALVNENRPVFRWDSAQAGQLYSLEIATTADFKTLVSRSPFVAGLATTPDSALPAGHYFWRVVSLAGGDTFASSPPRQLSVVGRLQMTRVISVNYAGGQARVFWRQVPGAEAYELQVAEDEYFQLLRNSLTLPDTHATLALTPDKTWYVRVRAVGGPLTVSEFGEGEPVRIRNP